MADTKISELPVATAIASPDVAPIVQGGVTKQADVSLFGGSSSSFISANVARFDPSGSNSTGVVGDLSKPFLSVQGAINAIQAGSFNHPAIDLGNNASLEDLTTSLQELKFIGTRSAFQTLTCTSPATVDLFFVGTSVSGSVNFDNTDSAITLTAGASLADITNTGGSLAIVGRGSGGVGTVSSPGGTIGVDGFNNLYGSVAEINSAGSAVFCVGTIVTTLTAAASISLQDSRIIANNAGITPTYDDTLLNPASMDFSTLPTSQPSRIGAAWIDTTGGFNIVKVKL